MTAGQLRIRMQIAPIQVSDTDDLRPQLKSITLKGVMV